jgi:type IV pilus assembly protein PilM
MALSLRNVFRSIKANPNLAQSAIGIDIGRSAVKIVELERNEEAPILKTYGEIQLGPYAEEPVGATVEFDSEVLQKAIVDVLRESGASATHGVLSLPLSAGFITVISITTREGEELASRIPVEARKFVPLPLQEVTLDWTPIGEAVENENGEMQHQVLLVALQNESVLAYKVLLEQVDLAQQPLELAMFSTARVTATNDAVAVIDLGAGVSKLYVYQGGMIAGIHRFTAGGAQVSKKISELLSVDFASAEELKRKALTDQTLAADIKRATAAVYDSSWQEMRRIITSFETSHGVAAMPVVLTGGVANTVGIEAAIGDVLQRPVTRSFPFAQVGYPAFMEDVLREIGPSFSISLGAALRHLQ